MRCRPGPPASSSPSSPPPAPPNPPGRRSCAPDRSRSRHISCISHEIMTTEILQEQDVLPSRRMPWHIAARIDEKLDVEPSPETLTAREWLVTNGLGGYASGTLSGVPTRRYHGLLIAALPAPLGRTLMLGQVSEVLRLPDHRMIDLGGLARQGQPTPEVPGAGYFREFRLEAGLPVWRYEVESYVLEKRV